MARSTQEEQEELSDPDLTTQTIDEATTIIPEGHWAGRPHIAAAGTIKHAKSDACHRGHHPNKRQDSSPDRAIKQSKPIKLEARKLILTLPKIISTKNPSFIRMELNMFRQINFL